MRFAIGVVCVFAVGLVGCQPAAPPTAAPAAVPQPTPTPADPLSLAEAFAQGRNEFDATLRFLQAADPTLDDADLIRAANAAAFDDPDRTPLEGGLLLTRADERAVVAYPNGRGLVLFDDGAPPVQLTRWALDVIAVQAVWLPDEAGISYVTLRADGGTTIHYILAARSGSGWEVRWHSDDNPDWWFNARDARIAVAPDLSRLIVTGQATNTTNTFAESFSDVTRDFTLLWERDEDSRYQPALTASAFASRQEWLWRVAEPSAYTTLVEFIERLRLSEVEEAAGFTADPSVLEDALDFGLALPERQFIVTAATETRIEFRDTRGAFVATFITPRRSGGPWLLTGVRPLGAQ
ncbi:MAG: hypothetical protein ACFB51_05165 [Anaerolineae bacterium]